jgi:hypothetical protein
MVSSVISPWQCMNEDTLRLRHQFSGCLRRGRSHVILAEDTSDVKVVQPVNYVLVGIGRTAPIPPILGRLHTCLRRWSHCKLDADPGPAKPLTF